MPADPMLTRGAPVPHFAVRGPAGERVAYSAIWQQRSLLLVALPEDEAPDTAAYVAQLKRDLAELTANDIALVVTTSEIPGVPRPGVVVADRWGETQFVAAADSVAELPASTELLEWLRYVQIQCPECQGEVK